MNKEYRIVEFYPGKFGYKQTYYELQHYNEVYKHWYSVNNGFLGLEFINSYCLLHDLKYEEIPHFYQDKQGSITVKAGRS